MERFNPQYMQRHSELHLLSLAWKARRASNVAFVALDTEFVDGRNNFTHVVELGLSYAEFQSHSYEETPVIKTRNIIVKDGEHLRRMVPFTLDKPEYVEKAADLKVLLDSFFEDLVAKNDRIVLFAHDALEDLNRLQRACSWRPSRAIVSLDTQRIWYALRHRTNGGSLGVACKSYGIAFNPQEHHSAGHDAKHTLELGLHKAKHSLDRSASSSPAPDSSAAYSTGSAGDSTATRALGTPTSDHSNLSCASVTKTEPSRPHKKKLMRLMKKQEAARRRNSSSYELQKEGGLRSNAAGDSSKFQTNAAKALPGHAESTFDGEGLDLGSNVNPGVKPSGGKARALRNRGLKRQRSVSDPYTSGEGTSTDVMPRPVSYKKRKLESSGKSDLVRDMPFPDGSVGRSSVATATDIVDLTADTPPPPGFITNMDPVDLTRE